MTTDGEITYGDELEALMTDRRIRHVPVVERTAGCAA